MLSRLKKALPRHAMREGLIVVFDQGILSIATFLTGIMVARSTSPELYGIYILGWSIVLIAQGVFRNMVILPMTVYSPRFDDDERFRFHGSTLVHAIVFTCITSLLIFGWYMSSDRPDSDSDLVAYLPIITLMTAALLWRDLIRNILLAQLRVLASVGINLLSTVLTLLIIGYIFFAGDLMISDALWSFTAFSILAAATMMIRHTREFKIELSATWPDFLRGWVIGKWSCLNGIGFIGMSQLYPWIILWFIDQNSVGIFGACMATATMASPIMRGANAYILPRIAHGFRSGDMERLGDLTRRSIIALFIPYSAWLLIALVFHKEMVSFFYGDGYEGSGLLFIMLVLKTCIDNVTSPVNSALQTAEHAEQLTIALFIGTILTLALSPAMVNTYGLTGIGYVAIIASTSSAFWKFYALRRLRASD